MAKTKFYECCRCDKITRQVELSMREWSAIRNESVIDQAMSTFVDCSGIVKTMSFIIGRGFYKCCECGRCSIRTVAGKDVGSQYGGPY